MNSDPPAAEPWLAAEANGAVRKQAPATQRNRDAIAAVLRDILPRDGLVLEIASGSGEHAVHFAALFPGLTWQPERPQSARAGVDRGVAPPCRIRECPSTIAARRGGTRMAHRGR